MPKKTLYEEYRIYSPKLGKWYRGARCWRWTRFRCLAACCDCPVMTRAYWLSLADRYVDDAEVRREEQFSRHPQ